jgi:hypothetical protein
MSLNNKKKINHYRKGISLYDGRITCTKEDEKEHTATNYY